MVVSLVGVPAAILAEVELGLLTAFGLSGNLAVGLLAMVLTRGSLLIVPPIVCHDDGSGTFTLVGTDSGIQNSVDGVPPGVDVTVEQVGGERVTPDSAVGQLSARQQKPSRLPSPSATTPSHGRRRSKTWPTNSGVRRPRPPNTSGGRDDGVAGAAGGVTEKQRSRWPGVRSRTPHDLHESGTGRAATSIRRTK